MNKYQTLRELEREIKRDNLILFSLAIIPVVWAIYEYPEMFFIVIGVYLTYKLFN